MIIFPAIDLRQGKAVRLLQGRLEDTTVYADDPCEVARDFARQGAEYLHLVDLDGAFSGEPVNDSVIREIVRAVGLKVQVGGGIRSLGRIADLLAAGVARVILGTAAVREPELVKEAVALYGDRIVVGIDAKDGNVAVQGWSEATEITAIDLGRAMKAAGIERMIFTDISRDGMLQGPNLAASLRQAAATGLKVIISGGVASLQDLRDIRKEVKAGSPIEGVIIGKALYSKAFTLKEALAAAAEEE
ncbi:MAG: 1-(5-phosphoribosyl)-5-[(5-phosphoribosylamino)methylideneamino]imidazole-4-carboxamide isomerase [Peptococcaceae bacterium]|jgi:phosphoribosylformimino-5-aminoimidazole carboxamide ribotide isomerase|nr:1-(5-phosphoribosyl)-5-[(5-phosphoribosylamino)methylideneamino]imidazole-4-carboxamide isomerase [Peptococcaceae bacterium]